MMTIVTLICKFFFGFINTGGNYEEVIDGWKPGAVSKRLLHMLNKAKLIKSTAGEIKKIKRIRKPVKQKPTIKICKKDGQYCIELQATETPNESNTPNTPLVYKIESENNKAKIIKKDKIQRRLIRDAVKNVWSDPFKPEYCANTCFKTLKESVGIFDEEDLFELGDELDSNYSCSCEDEEVSSCCTSSEVDWEIEFTPPIVRYQTLQRDTADLLMS